MRRKWFKAENKTQIPKILKIINGLTNSSYTMRSSSRVTEDIQEESCPHKLKQVKIQSNVTAQQIKENPQKCHEF